MRIWIQFVAFIGLGIFFSAFWAFIGIAFDRNDLHETSGFVDSIFAFLAIISTVLSLYSLSQIQSAIKVSIDGFTAVDCGIGIALSFIGLLVFTISYFNNN